MQQQTIDHAFSTADLFCNFNVAEESKYTLRDLLASTSQVAGTLGACWMLHLFV